MALTPYRDILFTARWLQKNIQLVRVDGHEYEKKFGTRTPAEILESRQVSYMNACPDMTMAFILLLKRKGYRPTMVIEQREGQRTGSPTLHLATEINLNGKTITVDFADSRRIIHYTGRYQPKKSHTQRSYRVHRYSSKRIGPNTTLNQIIRVRNTSQLYKRFSHVTPAAAKAVFEAMRRDDSPRLFNMVTRRKRVMKRVR